MKFNKITEKILIEAEKQFKEGNLDEDEFKKVNNLNQQSFDLISYFINNNMDQVRTVSLKLIDELFDGSISTSEANFISSQITIIIKSFRKRLKS